MNESTHNGTGAEEKDEAPRAGSHIKPLKLQDDRELPAADHYQLDDLLQYHDQAFVIQTYTLLTGSAPTIEQLTNTLDKLRSGRLSKIEIIDRVMATRAGGQPAVRVVGLPSTTARWVARWPLIGYVLRIVKGLARLPVLIQDQQRFEAYALAQQQHIADYINDVLAPAAAVPSSDLSRTINDAVESVLMLSDSVIELTARHHEATTQLQSQLAQLQSQLQQLQSQLEELQAGQTTRHEWQLQVQENLRALADAQIQQQQLLERVQSAQSATATAQQEFLVQEQRVIVETQKLVLGQIETEVQELATQQGTKSRELATQIRELQATVDSLKPRARRQAVGSKSQSNTKIT
jgi:hypothetical protein